MPSTESSTMPSTPQNLSPERELQRGLRMREGLKRLGHLESIDSIGNSLEWELEALKAQSAMDLATINGTETSQGSAPSTEADMQKQLIAGDVVNNNYYSSNEQAATPAAPTATPATTADKAKVTSADIKLYIKKKIAEGLAQSQATSTAPAVASAEQPAESQSWLKKYWPLIVGGAVGLGGAGVAAVKSTPATTPTPAVVPTAGADTNTQYKFQISSEQGKGFSTE